MEINFKFDYLSTGRHRIRNVNYKLGVFVPEDGIASVRTRAKGSIQ
jgi:hypothetical protein